jgi:hypothetical protein
MLSSLHQRLARIDTLLLAALALALPIILITPLLSGQLPGTHDAELHLHRLVSAALNWREGVAWGRWSPQLHHGYGYPIGNFYAPGWHVAGGALVALGAPAVTVWLLFQAGGIALYAVGGYLWAREIGGRGTALVAAAAFTYAPMRFFELLSQGNLSQFLAMGLIAWVLWAVARCARQPSRRRVALAALLLAALVVTHHPTAALAVPLVAFYVLVAPLLAGQRPYATLAALALGLLIAAIYWLPALAEAQYVNLSGAVNQYPYAEYFIPPHELFAPSAAVDPAALNAPLVLNVGQAQLALAALGALVALLPRARLNRWQRVHAIGGALLLALCLYMTTYHSAWLWDRLPLARFILYPWRFLGLAAVLVIPGVVALTDGLRLPRLAVAALLVVIIGMALPLMQPVYPNVEVEQPVTAGTSIRYELATGNLGAVATAEYTPIWAAERPMAFAREEAATFDGWAWNIRPLDSSIPDSVTITTRDGAARTETLFDVNSDVAFTLQLHQFYFPGWQAALDGVPIAIEIAAPTGVMQVAIPAGTHTLALRYAGTTVQHVADVLAIVGLVGCGMLFLNLTPKFPLRVQRGDFQTSDADVLQADTARLVTIDSSDSPSLYTERGTGSEVKTESGFGVVLVVGLVFFALAYAGIVLPQRVCCTPRGDMDAPAGMQTRLEGVWREGDTPLLGLMGMSSTQQGSVAAGDWMYVDLYWRALRPLEVDWHVALELRDPTAQLVWARSDHGAPGGVAASRWTTDGYIMDRHILRVPANAEPYMATLALKVYQPDGGELVYDGAPLPTLRITNPQCDAPPTDATVANVRYGDLLTLRAYHWLQMGDSAALDLYWRTDTPDASEDALFIHFMQGDTLLLAADRPPIPAYGSGLWQAGQCLSHHSTLDIPAGADRVLIGYYDRATGVRMSARTDGAALEADGLVIMLGE